MLPHLFTLLSSRTVAASYPRRWAFFFLALQRCSIRFSIIDRIRFSKIARRASWGLGLEVGPLRAERSVCLAARVCVSVCVNACLSIYRSLLHWGCCSHVWARSAVHVFSEDANVNLYEKSQKVLKETYFYYVILSLWVKLKRQTVNRIIHRLNIVCFIETCFLK